MDSEDNIFKVLLVGEGGVGKTSLIKKFVYQKFDEKYIKTLGTNISKKDVPLGPDHNNETAHLQIWDVLGQKVFQAIIKSAFNGARGVIFVCDITDEQSFKKLEVWVNYAYEFGPKASFLFIANKSDLPDHKFTIEDLEKFASKFNAPAFVTSAKSGDHVDDAFARIGQSVYSKDFAPPRDQVDLKANESMEIPENIQAEDKVITLFCQEAGGYQVTMPIVRQHFAKHKIDWENPTKEDIKKVILSLATYLKFIKGEEVAKDFERAVVRALKKEKIV